MRPASEAEWQSLNEEIYDICQEVQQTILDQESEGVPAYDTFVDVGTRLSFFIERVQRDLGMGY